MIPRRFITTIFFHRAMIVAALLLFSLNAGADEVSSPIPKAIPTTVLQSANQADPVSASHLGQLVVGLIIVLICIVALAWLARRFNRFQATTDGSLRLLGGMSMGARERIVLVQVGARQLLLGVAPGRINTLHVLDDPLDVASNVSNESMGKGFAEKLSAALSKNQQK